MGTKNNPGAYDCYANAEPDEPMFVLLGRDPVASFVVHIWADACATMGTSVDKIDEARHCADLMCAWAIEKGKDTGTALAALGERTPPAAIRDEFFAIASAVQDYLNAHMRLVSSETKPDELIDDVEAKRIAFLNSTGAFMQAIQCEILRMQDEAAR